MKHMNLRPTFFVLVASTIVLFELKPAGAQEIDAIADISVKLASKGDFLLARSCSNVCLESERRCTNWFSCRGEMCLTDTDFSEAESDADGPADGSEKYRECTAWETVCVRSENQCSENWGELTPQFLDVFVEEQGYGKTQRLGGIDKWYRTSTSLNNCSSQPQTTTTNLALSMTTGSSTTVSDTVSRTNSFGLALQAGFSFFASSSVTANYSYAKQVSMTNARTENETQTIGIAQTVPIVAAPGKEVTAELNSVSRTFRKPFEASVLVDGPLNANLDDKTMVSDVLSEEERRYLVGGHIDAVVGTEGFVELYERNASCEGRDGEVNLIKAGQSVVDVGGSSPVDVIERLLPDQVVVKENEEFPVSSGVLDGLSFGDLAEALIKRSLNANAFVEKRPGVMGSGMHLCQSTDSIGHSCQVFGFFPDCNAALVGLSAQNCCFATPQGGTSISFTMKSCM